MKCEHLKIVKEYRFVKKLVLVLILTLSLANAGDDKSQHAAASFVLGAAGAMIAEKYGATPTEAFFWGLGTVLVVGLAKEAYDSRSEGNVERNDMVANAIGGSLGAGTGIVLMKFSTGSW